MIEIRCKNCKSVIAREREGGLACEGATIRQPVNLICNTCKKQRSWQPAKKPLQQTKNLVESARS